MRYLIIFSLLFVGCDQLGSDTVPEYVVAGNAIGTTYAIKYYNDTELELEQPIDSIVKMFNESMSTWVADSQINKFNNGQDSVMVGKAFQTVFKTAQDIYRKTDGYFDPTVGNLVNAYGFGANGEQTKIPTQEQVDSLKQFVGFHKLDLVASAAQDSMNLISSQPGMYLEFNAIGKGTLVDYLAQLLEDRGVDNYLIEVGGEVTAKGKSLNRDDAWVVGIDDPTQNLQNRRLVGTVSLENKAMAGSGNYRKYRITEDGEQFVHTINPLTGLARPSKVVGVNVIAENCTIADGYATAFMAMPLEKSRELLPNLPEIDVLIMYLDENDELQLESTPGFNLKPQL
ncbi:FAD:protein FMN transferase [Nonlabens ponticola]|uniref:FAD:protein FMN transferase n=1 Tax=Nonlabens ponticola TaxID=2496866 RepID=A0A3S9MUC9_9FLAO|nr:FAD:protein FMN transferase [Nonlabens ponticola]AZQ42771.1 FAD:protein FMN transferase [Nonlabens ponticola]